jgi:hypothetical protein
VLARSPRRRVLPHDLLDAGVEASADTLGLRVLTLGLSLEGLEMLAAARCSVSPEAAVKRDVNSVYVPADCLTGLGGIDRTDGTFTGDLVDERTHFVGAPNEP